MYYLRKMSLSCRLLSDLIVMSNLQLMVDGVSRDWHFLIKDNRADETTCRIFTTPAERIRMVRRYYHPVLHVYRSRYGQEAVDYAFEAFLLGFVDVLDLVSLMRDYKKWLDDVELPF